MKQLLLASACVGMIVTAASSTAFASVEPPGIFIRDAIKGDNSEIDVGRLAERDGATKGVRDYGRMLVHDHMLARDQAVAVARGMNIAPPSRPLAAAERVYRKLEGLSGPAFDREFLRDMVSDHQQDIRDFRGETAAQNSAVSNLAQMQLPTLEKHLRMAELLTNRERG